MDKTGTDYLNPGATLAGPTASVQVPVVIISRHKTDHHYPINYNPEQTKIKGHTSPKCKLGTKGLTFLKNILWDIGSFYRVAAFRDDEGAPAQPLTSRNFAAGICNTQICLLMPIIFGTVPNPPDAHPPYGVLNNHTPPLWLVYKKGVLICK
ncbi:hypothetical protein HK102_010370, partial [Quaeritorhiza haematococci]